MDYVRMTLGSSQNPWSKPPRTYLKYMARFRDGYPRSVFEWDKFRNAKLYYAPPHLRDGYPRLFV